MNEDKTYTKSYYLNEIEKVWLSAWQRELGPDATLTHEEQSKLHELRLMASGEDL